MLQRTIKLSKSNSLFLFGARGTGKSTLLKEMFLSTKTLWIDLLVEEKEELFRRNPDELSRILALKSYEKVVIDEVQKVPKLLDIVQKEMGEHPKIQFILTGSSARKLKRGLGNLLAGRAFTYQIYPFTSFELRKEFKLMEALNLGTLPGLLTLSSKEDKIKFLKSYVRSYLKEEIRLEQLIRKLDPFQDFLEIAAQQNGKIINYSNIAKDVGVDFKTIINYFTILEDTLLGFFLPSFHRSIRKQQRLAPKSYFFDTGVKKALDRTLNLELSKKTYAFKEAFEHWIIIECFRLNEYSGKDYKFSYLRTKDGAEIDLIIERPGEKDIIVEIKSTDRVKESHVRNLVNFKKNWKKPCEAQIWSLDKIEKKIKTVPCLFWENALKKLF